MKPHSFNYDRPNHKHNCSKCVYIRSMLMHDTVYDWYSCANPDREDLVGPTIIGRFGQDPQDYVSFPVSVLEKTGYQHAMLLIIAKSMIWISDEERYQRYWEERYVETESPRQPVL